MDVDQRCSLKAHSNQPFRRSLRYPFFGMRHVLFQSSSGFYIWSILQTDRCKVHFCCIYWVCLSVWMRNTRTKIGLDHESFVVSHIRFLLLFTGCLSNVVILFESSKILSCSHRYSAFSREKWRKPGMHCYIKHCIGEKLLFQDYEIWLYVQAV